MNEREREQLKRISRRIEKAPIICKKCGGIVAIIGETGRKPAEVRAFEKRNNVKGYAECARCGTVFVLMKLD